MNQTPSYAEFARIEPLLLNLEQKAAAIKDDPSSPYFCANEHFFGHDKLKDQLSALVGWSAKDERLRSNEAYDVVYEHLYDMLPPCRNCSCLLG